MCILNFPIHKIFLKGIKYMDGIILLDYCPMMRIVDHVTVCMEILKRVV